MLSNKEYRILLKPYLIDDISNMVISFLILCDTCDDFKHKLYNNLTHSNYTSKLNIYDSALWVGINTLTHKNFCNASLNLNICSINKYGKKDNETQKMACVSIDYLSMLLVHKLDSNHIFFKKPKYNIYNKLHHITQLYKLDDAMSQLYDFIQST
jgi:hypothetical protein